MAFIFLSLWPVESKRLCVFFLSKMYTFNEKFKMDLAHHTKMWTIFNVVPL